MIYTAYVLTTTFFLAESCPQDSRVVTVRAAVWRLPVVVPHEVPHVFRRFASSEIISRIRGVWNNNIFVLVWFFFFFVKHYGVYRISIKLREEEKKIDFRHGHGLMAGIRSGKPNPEYVTGDDVKWTKPRLLRDRCRSDIRRVDWIRCSHTYATCIYICTLCYEIKIFTDQIYISNDFV